MPEPFFSSAIEVMDEHPQLGVLRYTIVATIPKSVPNDKIDRVMIRAIRLAHNRAIALTGGDL